MSRPADASEKRSITLLMGGEFCRFACEQAHLVESDPIDVQRFDRVRTHSIQGIEQDSRRFEDRNNVIPNVLKKAPSEWFL
ncbi:MAG: hypothetical protein HY788_10460 [Deltaproteobacteria bacterium]|nr:hypothetical protein [Deltaproteobacteria bacterium]